MSCGARTFVDAFSPQRNIMVSILISWCVIVFCTETIGRAVLSLLGADRISEDSADQTVIAIWIGLGTAAIFFATVGLFVAVEPWAGAVFMVVAGLRGICEKAGPTSRSPIYQFRYVGLILVLALHFATVSVDSLDTGLYHQQAVSWLSHYGFVRGLAWLHARLGMTSSWFALAAVFNHGILAGRVSPILGGFITTLSVWHWAVKLDRVMTRRARPSDWFLILAYPMLLTVAWVWHLEVSLGPDLATWIITILVVWVAMLGVSSETISGAVYLPLLLAAIGCSFKLSLLPLLPLALLFPSLASPKSSARRISRTTAGVCLLPVLLSGLSNLTTSGCPLYPSTVGCVAAEWAVSKTVAQSMATSVREYSRWSDIGGRRGKADSDLSWIRFWVLKKEKIGLLALVAAGAIVMIHRWSVERSWFLLWVLSVGFSGLLFVFWSAPNPRFGLGFFLLFPAMALAATIGRRQVCSGGPNRLVPRSLVVVLLIAIVVRTDLGARGVQHVLVPEALPAKSGSPIHILDRRTDRWTTLQTETVVRGSLRYTKPISSTQCWNLPLPCSPFYIDAGVRVSPHGLAGGFLRP